MIIKIAAPLGIVVDDACECGSPVEWFRPYPGNVNATRSVWLWPCERCGRIWTKHFSDDGFEYLQVCKARGDLNKGVSKVQYS